MRVIQVVDLYGDEAVEYIENLNKASDKEIKKDEKKNNSVQYDDSVLGVDVEEDKDDDMELIDIFPDEGEDKGITFVGDLDDDLTDELDKEDDYDEDIDDLPVL